MKFEWSASQNKQSIPFVIVQLNAINWKCILNATLIHNVTVVGKKLTRDTQILLIIDWVKNGLWFRNVPMLFNGVFVCVIHSFLVLHVACSQVLNKNFK